MRNLRTLALTLALCVALLCPALALAETDAAVTVTDMTGRVITLPEPATRVVALTASDCEILYAIGAGDALVGRGEYCDYPEAVFAVPSVQSGYNTNIEQIIELKPQVLLMSTMAQTVEQVEALEKAGIRVVVSDAQDIEGVYEAITLIGALMGKEDTAAQVASEMKQTLEAVAERAHSLNGRTVYFEVSPLQYGLWTAGSHTFMDEIATMLGFTNCFSDVEGWAGISEEEVIARNPDMIVTISMDYGQEPTVIDEILGRPGWEGMNAIQQGAVLNLANNELSRPSPRLADGARMMLDFALSLWADKQP